MHCNPKLIFYKRFTPNTLCAIKIQRANFNLNERIIRIYDGNLANFNVFQVPVHLALKEYDYGLVSIVLPTYCLWPVVSCDWLLSVGGCVMTARLF